MAMHLKRHDWILNGLVLFLLTASFITLLSISPTFFWRQVIWAVVALAVIVLVSLVDWRPLASMRWVILSFYLASLALLVLTLFVAPSIRNARSWLIFGPIQFQPAELAKVALIIILAYFFSKKHVGIAYVSVLARSFVYAAIPAALIVLQPDLGSALIIIGIWAAFLLVSGIRWKHLGIGVLALALVVALSWQFMLRDYQKERVVGLFDPAYDPLGVNYSVIQSKIAIGSAGFLGKGFGQGTQVQLGFLPEAQNDFILAAFIEEWGFLGGLAVLVAALFLVMRMIQIGLHAKNNFSKLIALGAAMMFVLQVALNAGSTVGLLPVVGVSFPFLSYGGSNLLMSALLVGILQSIVVRSSFVS